MPADLAFVSPYPPPWRSIISSNEVSTEILGRESITRFRVSPHKLRHTANVVARLAGIEPHTRSRLLNHNSPQSLQRYEHLLPDELHEARAVQQSALGRYLGKNGAVSNGAGTGNDDPDFERCW